VGPAQPAPELWSLYNARVHPGEHVRVFPISNWTELDVWQYIARERWKCLPSTTRTGARWCAPRPDRAGHAAHAGARRRDGRGSLGALPHGGRHQLHLPGGIDALTIEESSKRPDAHADRARRDAHGRPDLEASMERRKKEGYF
jgi:sulfate adenylyltransferase subunit 2